MGLRTSIDRASEYYKRHGLKATISRAALAVRRELFSGRMVVFYCDLAEQDSRTVTAPNSMRIDRLSSEAELSPQDLEVMTGFWNPTLAHRNIRDRFATGASLWVIKCKDTIAGYGWTLQGRTIEPYYLPLGQDDVHLFDFLIFPQYRGQSINPRLVTYILRNLATVAGGRAFIDAAEWNTAQLSSLRKTPFRRLGLVRAFKIFGHTFTHWVENEALEPVHERERRAAAAAMARPHER